MALFLPQNCLGNLTITLINMDRLLFRRKEKKVVSRSSEESYAGSGKPDSSLLTTPVTPSPPWPLATRLRRTRGSSEDEPPRDEDEIRNEDYQTGGSHHCNLPAITECVPEVSALALAWKNAGIKQAIIELLKIHAVEWKDLSIFKRKHFREPEIDSEALTETTSIMAAKTTGEGWRVVCRDIRNAGTHMTYMKRM